MGIRAKSITRAAKRGHFIDWNGCYIMRRPFNNRKNTSKGSNHSRKESERIRKMWTFINTNKHNE